MNIITGYMGTPHITSAQDRGQNQGCFGTGSYILDVGQQLAAEIVSANEIRIRDGVLSHQGCVGIIEQGAYDSLEIANGSQGMQRIDLIVARYEKNTETSVESLNLVVIEGTAAASNPTAPTYNEGDIQAGDSPVDMPLYQVNINGVNIASTTLVASKVQTQAELQSAVSELNSKAIQESGGNANGRYIKFADGTLIQWFRTEVTNLAFTAYGTLYSATYNWTYPIAFVNNPTVCPGQFRWGTGASWCTASGVSQTAATLTGFDAYQRASGTRVVISAFAIGLWK